MKIEVPTKLLSFLAVVFKSLKFVSFYRETPLHFCWPLRRQVRVHVECTEAPSGQAPGQARLPREGGVPAWAKTLPCLEWCGSRNQDPAASMPVPAGPLCVVWVPHKCPRCPVGGGWGQEPRNG